MLSPTRAAGGEWSRPPQQGEVPKRDNDPMKSPWVNVSHDEKRWAIEIRQAVADADDIRYLTDLECLQYAIASQGDLPAALKRIRGLQHFRDEYDIQDTIGQALGLIRRFMELQPGVLLSVDRAVTSSSFYSDRDDQDLDDNLNTHYLMVFDMAKLNPKRIRLPQHWRIFLGGLYYVYQVTQSSPHAMRKGVLAIVECEGMTWDNICLEVAERVMRELTVSYPIEFQEISCLRTATAANIFYSLCIPYIPRDIRDKINLGCAFPIFDGRLDELFRTHYSIADNRQKILDRAEQHLYERLFMEQTIILDD